MKINKFILGAIALSVVGFASCKSDKSAEKDSDSIVAVDDEYPAAPVLTPRQIATSDSVFAALKASRTFASNSIYSTPSGLRYMVVKKGEGKKPTATDAVKVHYTGKLPDGTVFDSSVERGEPITFGLNQVIPGWTEGLQLMQEGGTTVFYIPSAMAYGPNGAGPQIGPNQDLVFEVELIEVNPQQ